MSAPESPKPDDSLEKLARVVEACGRFEEAWNKGPRPRIEDFLTEARPEERAEWLLRLLGLEFSLRRQAGERFDLAEYLGRFPLDTDTVTDAYISQTVQPEPPSRPGPRAGEKVKPPPRAKPSPPPKAETAAEILLTILAFQNGFIDLNTCVAAVRAWSEDKSKKVGDLLVRLGHIDAAQRAILDALVGQHRKKHGHSPEQGLAAVDPTGMVRDALKKVDDPDVERTITVTPTGPSPTPGSGETTADFGDDKQHSAHDEEWSYWSDHSRFQDGKEYARGNLGIVFKARDCELRRQVAVKVMKDEIIGSAPHRNQFLLEGLISGGLEHPGIVPVYGLGLKGDGSPFYAMKFVRGPSLKDKIRQLHGHETEPAEEAAPTLPQLLRYFISACQAMAYAHSRGILHRDLKPDHIMLGDYGETLLVDWGLATTFNPGHMTSGPSEAPLRLPKDILTDTIPDGAVVGTVAYLGPEQARGEVSRLDRRADIYGLGATLYCVLTGQAPQKGYNANIALDRIIAGEFPRPRSIKPSIPPALEAITLKAMALRPDDRYPTATALARDLERYLDDEPVHAYPDTLPMRAGRWLRKHRTFTAGGATLLFSSTLFLGGFLQQQHRAYINIRAEQQKTLSAKTTAEEYLLSSLTVIQMALFRLASLELTQVPGMEMMRKNVAQDAAKLLQALADSAPEDPRLLDAAAQVSRELGNIRRLMGDTKAQDDYQRAVDLLDKLERVQTEQYGPGPHIEKIHDRRIQTLLDSAEWKRRCGRLTDAGPDYERLLGLSLASLGRFPGSRALKKTQARVHYNYSCLLHSVGDYAGAMKHADASRDMLSPIATRPNADPSERLIYLVMRIAHGKALRDTGHAGAALDAFREVEARATRLIEDSPYKVDARFQIAEAKLETGRIGEDDPSSDQTAIEALGDAITRFEKLIADAPLLPQNREDLAYATIARAFRYHRLRKDREAEKDLETADHQVEVWFKTAPEHPVASSTKATILVRRGMISLDSGHPDEAKRLLDSAEAYLLRSDPKDEIGIRTARERTEGLDRIKKGSLPM